MSLELSGTRTANPKSSAVLFCRRSREMKKYKNFIGQNQKRGNEPAKMHLKQSVQRDPGPVRRPGVAPSTPAFGGDRAGVAGFGGRIFRKASCACGGACPACKAKTNNLK